MKNILGLDLGTNSIGWALISQNFGAKEGRIIGMGSRIIPMSQDVLGNFDSGVSVSQTAERTRFRSIRRLRERHLLRRERLHRVLNILDFLPSHYADQIDFDKRLGQFLPGKEPKLAYNLTQDFLFKKSFEEMLKDFASAQPHLVAHGRKIPYDWTIYWLRKKALTQKIEKEELAWLLLNFNQKRGYYQLRGEEEEEHPNKLTEFHSLVVADVVADERQKGKDEIWYSVVLENGWVYRRASKFPLFEWKGKTKEFVVTTDLNDDGTIKMDKEGNEKRSFRAPSENDWTLVKTKTEQTIDKSGKTVGAYIYDTLLQNPSQKINGKLVRVVERKFYKEELLQILIAQQKFHPELQDAVLYKACITELYENNEAHRNSIAQKDFVHLFLNDIIFYQRPLKSKTSQIGDCRYEVKQYKDKAGAIQTAPVKCIAKSHPLFQEFRLWQWIRNLHIYNRENDQTPVTDEFLKNETDYVQLFDFLNERKEITQDVLIKYLLEPQKLKAKALAEMVSRYRWNYIDDKEKKYPCNETRSQIVARLEKCKNIPVGFLTKEKEEQLWHILYSVSDKIEIAKALETFAGRNNLGDDFVAQFKKFPPYKNEYGSYSAKAIKKLLPLMRMGKYWSEDAISLGTQDRINKILTGEYDENIQDRVRQKAILLSDISHFRALPLWLASYVVYDRHSEEGSLEKWITPEDLNRFLSEFKQHSLRNPIVEQVILETLRTVRDIWQTYGDGQEDFFDEIHIELGREMKNPADKRKYITEKNNENENTNLRIKALLMELLNDGDVANVRPYSPGQQEILKIYEDGALNSSGDVPDDILKISKAAQPTKSELIRYRLWLEQRYRSPYTGEVIPLNLLFTPAYEIEHIIPQSRFFDDSFNNKVICEAEVNKLKDNRLGLEFIQSCGTQKIQVGLGKTVDVLSEKTYEAFVKNNYHPRSGKRKLLLLTDVPEKMIERQMNDTRYISKEVKNLLSKLVRRESNDDGATSVNVLSSNGQITSTLRQDWGLNDVWNDIITPRFVRLNEITGNTGKFGEINPNTHKFLPVVPIEYQKGFSKKRIDHRHHALDALVIACATRNHINLLNNQYANSSKRYDLQRLLRRFERVSYTHSTTRELVEKEVPKEFLKPWGTLTQDARGVLLTTVVSFKQNVRVINKTVNEYEKWARGVDGKPEKVRIKQTQGDSWAIRKPMHKDTVSGLVSLRLKRIVSLASALDNWQMIVDKPLKAYLRVLIVNQQFDKKMLVKHFKDTNNVWNGRSLSKVEIYYWDNENVASRVMLDDSFNAKKIESITDTGIQKILLKHLEQEKYQNQKDEKGKAIAPETLAFSPEGIDWLNENIKALNEGKFHQPIFKVRTYEPKGNKFNVGGTGNKMNKFVEAAKGTNLFFAIYVDESGKRSYETIPLNIIIERQKQGLSSVPEVNEKGDRLVFHLSPNDLVYVPNEEERGSQKSVNIENMEQIQRIYKFVSCTGNEGHFVPHYYSKEIIKNEMGTNNKSQNALDGTQIKAVCLKLIVDRIGRIKSNSYDQTNPILRQSGLSAYRQ